MIKRGQMYNREIIRTRPLCMNPSTSTQLCQTAWAIIFSNSFGLESDYRAPSVTQTPVPKQVTSWVFICIFSKSLILLAGIWYTIVLSLPLLWWNHRCFINFCSAYGATTWNHQRGMWAPYLQLLELFHNRPLMTYFTKNLKMWNFNWVVLWVQCGTIQTLFFLCLLLLLILMCSWYWNIF